MCGSEKGNGGYHVNETGFGKKNFQGDELGDTSPLD